MRRHLKLALSILLVVIACKAGWQALREREPVYQGKTLSKWLAGYSYSPGSMDSSPLLERPQSLKAAEAVSHLGTNAVPTLLRMLRATDASWKIKLVELAGKQGLRIRHTPASEINMRASMAFASLECASNIVSELVQIYKENRSECSQNSVVNALGSIGPGAEMAVPCLLDAAVSTNFDIRNNALGALGDIHARPELVVPLLTKTLGDSNAMVRGAAAIALREFGPTAKPAVPLLVELLEDQSEYASSLAAEALEHIDPESTARVRAAYKSRWE